MTLQSYTTTASWKREKTKKEPNVLQQQIQTLSSSNDPVNATKIPQTRVADKGRPAERLRLRGVFRSPNTLPCTSHPVQTTELPEYNTEWWNFLSLQPGSSEQLLLAPPNTPPLPITCSL
ncbi:hypothetical protein STEG23_026857 [Scotinomys teguina]